jgi:Cof subfamily protein (haloacid dehalogenase superfamily)
MACVFRLVATDLDGTLLHSDGTVTERSRDVIRAVEEQGVVVVFVTGRPIRWMEPLWPHVGDHGLAICSNGGIVYDVPSRSVVEARAIPREVGLEVAARIRRAVPGSWFAVERASGGGREDGFPTREDQPLAEIDHGPLEDIYTDDVVKLLALHLDVPPVDYWARVEQEVGDLVTTTWSSQRALIEMSAADVTKATTLAKVCAERGITPDEVLAFGDMPNDAAMLSWAGLSYAMADAHPLAREAADRIAPAHDEDGVAAVLEELFLSD